MQVKAIRRIQRNIMSVAANIELGLVKQNYPESQRPDIKKTLAAEFARTGLLDPIKPGDLVAVTSGSRGIEAMAEVIAAVVSLVREKGGDPLILPAMGSHGGGTPEGQIEVLAHLGQTEETLGARIYDRYEPRVVGTVFDEDVPVYVEGRAVDADHVILVGRVKEHTEFCGPIESGLLKMAVVGLGRMAGATAMHSAAVKYTYARTIMEMAGVIFKTTPILGGVALVEDQRNVLKHLEAVPVDRIMTREPELLKLSQEFRAKLPYDRLDILLLDEMGKDISGSGLDTKVIGRIMNIYEPELTSPRITRIVTLRMSEKGGGNANGLGLPDYITKELYDAVDFPMTALNVMIAVTPEKGRCPIVRDNARHALEGALETVGPYKLDTLEMAWITSTKDVEYLAVTPALWEKAASDPWLTRLFPPRPIPLSADGNLPPLNFYLDSLRKDLR